MKESTEVLALFDETIIDHENEDEWAIQDMYDLVEYEADLVLDSNVYVRVSGIANRWNGSQSVDTFIPETTLKEILRQHMNADQLVIIVFKDRVEIENHHHDGSNYYTLKPFDLYSLTIPELKDMADDADSFNDWREQRMNSYSKAKKEDLINYIEEHDLL